MLFPMTPLHIRAQPGDVAPAVLLPGDPGRATFIAETFFDAPELYNGYRGLLGYTGLYRGMPVSVQTTGMGCPSLAIVVEELVQLGAKTLVRVGTAGIIGKDVAPGDLVVATASVPQDGTTRMYLRGEPHAPAASFEVTRALVEATKAEGKAAGDETVPVHASVSVHVGLIQTEDAFYATTPDDVARLAARGVLAVEMEASALFLLGQLRGVRTGCALVASNRIGDPAFVDPALLQKRVSLMARGTLEALYTLHTQE